MVKFIRVDTNDKKQTINYLLTHYKSQNQISRTEWNFRMERPDFECKLSGGGIFV